nr:uncharacterized protein LOC128687326 [Cherax quadricarinatus]
MEYIQIVQRPAYSQRPYGLLRSPYTDHPGCSVLCNHPTCPAHPRNLLNLTRASWLQEARAHMTRAGTTQLEGDGDTGERRTPSSMPFTPLGTEGLQVNIPEEFLARFARSDSRPDSPAPTLFVHTSRLAPFRRCVTPDTLEPMRRPRHEVLRRATSLQDVATTRTHHTFTPAPPAGRGADRRKQGRFEADFTTKLSKQLDLVAKGQQQQQQQQQQTQREQQRQQQDKKPSVRGPKPKLKAQESEDSGLGGDKQQPAKRRPRRGGKKKGDEGGLDDPGQTAVSTVGDSRVGSSRRSGSSYSSKPTSARSSKSSLSHRRLHDPLSYDPKQFLGASNPPEDGSELVRLQETLGGGAALTDAEVFWFNLPRSPSHRAAVFTLPVQITRLLGMTPIDYLKQYMKLRTSRRQLYSMIFTRHRDLESIRVERLLVSDFGAALGDALGGTLTEAQLGRLAGLTPLPDLAMDREFFVLVSAFAERLFCYELLAAPDVEIEPRDLVEQLDFKQLDERLEGVELDPRLHLVLTTIRDLG